MWTTTVRISTAIVVTILNEAVKIYCRIIIIKPRIIMISSRNQFWVVRILDRK